MSLPLTQLPLPSRCSISVGQGAGNRKGVTGLRTAETGLWLTLGISSSGTGARENKVPVRVQLDPERDVAFSA